METVNTLYKSPVTIVSPRERRIFEKYYAYFLVAIKMIKYSFTIHVYFPSHLTYEHVMTNHISFPEADDDP